MDFPLFKTKLENSTRKFNLTDPSERWEYFRLKAGPEIEKLKTYLEEKTFIAYFLAKKGAGKGTYTQLLREIVGQDKIEHLSVGDLVRRVDSELADPRQKKALLDFLEQNYRGWQSLEEIIVALEKRNTQVLLPTELILTLVKREIASHPKKNLFLDGFPRELDQISYSLFFRDLAGYRDDRDIFVLIDTPERVIDERMKGRRVCPLCQSSKNLKVNPTSKIGYDGQEFYLLCDNPACQGAKMTTKEGDEKGIEPIRSRLQKDGELMTRAFLLYGIPKILLRNSLPLALVGDYADDYEITPAYSYEWDENRKEVRVLEKPWVFADDQGVPSVSLLAPPVVVSLIKQLVQVLSL